MSLTEQPPTPQMLRSAGDRILMHVLYGLHTLAWFSAGVLALVALIINYIRRSDDPELLYQVHHRYMIATFWWTLLWLIVFAPLWLLFIFPGWLAYLAVLIWYLYRCLKGWLRFRDDRPPTDFPTDPTTPT